MKKTLKNLITILSIAIAIFIAGAMTSTETQAASYGKISAKAKTITVGKKTTIKWKKTPKKIKKNKVKWSTSNKKVVKITKTKSNKKGITIKGMKAGKATITLKYKGKKVGKIKITVKAKPKKNNTDTNTTVNNKLPETVYTNPDLNDIRMRATTLGIGQWRTTLPFPINGSYEAYEYCFGNMTSYFNPAITYKLTVKQGSIIATLPTDNCKTTITNLNSVFIYAKDIPGSGYDENTYIAFTKGTGTLKITDTNNITYSFEITVE